MPLRVLILTYIYTDGDTRYGGEGRVVWETTQALARTGTKVFVATSMLKIAGKPHPNISVYKIPFAKKAFLNFNQGELLKMFFWCIPLIFLKRIQVIHHLPTNGPDPFARMHFGRVFAESADPSWDYTNPLFGEDLKKDRDNKMKEAGYTKKKSYDLSTRIAWRFSKLLGVNEAYPKGTDVFYCRARSLYPVLKKLRPESHLVYVPNGVNPSIFSPKVPASLSRRQNGLRFLHVGSVSRRKGVHYLVQAFIEVAKKHPESELIIAGTGEQEFVDGLKLLAASYPQIQFMGKVDDADLPGTYTSTDVACLVPLSGSTPTVLAEMLASGLPVIGTKDTGVSEVIDEYDAGLTVEAANAEDLSKAMLRMIEDPPLLKRLSANALHASQFFTWDYLAKQIIMGYKSALTKKHTY